MTSPTLLDPAAAPRPRRLLGHLAGTLPRRRAAADHRPADGDPTPRPAAGRPEPSWWDVLSGAADVADPGPPPRAESTAAPVPAAPATPVAVPPVPPPTVPAPTVPAPTVPAPTASPSVVRVSAVRPAPVRAPRAARSPGQAVAAASPGDVVPAPSAPRGATGDAAPAVGDPARVAAGPRAGAPPELVLADGRRVPLTSTVLVGRDPIPRAGETVGALLSVDDPARSVSKTHLLVGADAEGVWLVDRRSTNGTLVTLPDGRGILCVPERPVRLVAGARVDFGDHGFTLAAHADRPPAR